MSNTTPTIHPPGPETLPIMEGGERLMLPREITALDLETEKREVERRSAFPGMERHRRLFAKIEQIVRRYSINPLATDAEGKYTADFAKVREFLEREVKELENLDALIPLLRILR